MHNTVVAVVLSLLMAVAAVPMASQVAGSTTIGVSPDEVKTLTRGWSAKKQILGKPVFNDQYERVEEVEDSVHRARQSLCYPSWRRGGIPLRTSTWRAPGVSSRRRREDRVRGRYEGLAGTVRRPA